MLRTSWGWRGKIKENLEKLIKILGYLACVSNTLSSNMNICCEVALATSISHTRHFWQQGTSLDSLSHLSIPAWSIFSLSATGQSFLPANRSYDWARPPGLPSPPGSRQPELSTPCPAHLSPHWPPAPSIRIVLAGSQQRSALTFLWIWLRHLAVAPPGPAGQGWSACEVPATSHQYLFINIIHIVMPHCTVNTYSIKYVAYLYLISRCHCTVIMSFRLYTCTVFSLLAWTSRLSLCFECSL